METKSRPKKVGKAILVLEDGTFFFGKGFGAPCKVSGEVVFSTSMVGYTEALTDPSYHGQILTLTYPLIGNYGVPDYQNGVDKFGIPLHFESIGIKVAGLVIQELCQKPHHWSSERTLDNWLRSEGIPGICGIDTRRLTKKLREKGVMLGILKVCEKGVEPNIEELLNEAKRIPDPNMRDLCSEVTIENPIIYDNSGKIKVVLLDYGVKAGILRDLLSYGVNVIRVPYNLSFEQIMSFKPDRIVLSNGPGDPKRLPKECINTVKRLVEENIPVMGICQGTHVLSLALGGDTYKLKYGHRSQNQPAYDLETGRCYITTQNHGYATKPESLKSTDLEVWYINANDKTVEGAKHKNGRTFAVQWHPEAGPGPYDTVFLFERFLRSISD